MTKMSTFLVFLAGCALGSAGTYYYIKDKYERIAQEEIDSVKQVYAKRAEQDTPRPAVTFEKPDLTAYADKIRECNYNATSETPEEVESHPAPYVISPEEFGEKSGYDQVSLTYYADLVLADENDEVVENADEIVGMAALDSFGQYEDDSVFVRNDALSCDYEILLDQRLFSQVQHPN